MRRYLRGLLPYYRQVLGTIVIGSLCGLIMNTTVVLPAILRRSSSAATNRLSGSAARNCRCAYFGGVLLMESARAVKRWCLERTIPRMRSNVQADAFRGVLGWPMARLHTTPVGGLLSRIVGDAEVIRRGTDQLTVEVWDTFLMCASLATALFVYDASLSAVALLPLAIVLARATRQPGASPTAGWPVLAIAAAVRCLPPGPVASRLPQRQPVVPGAGRAGVHQEPLPCGAGALLLAATPPRRRTTPSRAAPPAARARALAVRVG